MVKKNCLTCNKEFFTYPYNIKEGKGKYCCKECYAKSLVKNKVFIRCKNCKNIFSTCPSQKKYNRKFCTFKCFNDYVKTKHPWNYHGSKKVKCANPKCTKTFTALNSKIKKGEHKYCSMQCQWDTRTLFNGEKSSTWRGGISFEPYSRDFNNSLKFMIRERFNFQCVECGIKENGKKHHIHHIDYNKKKNRLNNFFPLCINCHSITVHFPNVYIPYFQQKMKEFNKADKQSVAERFLKS